MKAIALNGSPRHKGNTALCIEVAIAELNKQGIETEILQLGGSNVRGCQHCDACYKTKNMRCIKNDDMNFFIEKTIEADGIILASPTYMSNVTTEVKAYIDRCGYVNLANDGKILKGKIGIPIVTMARSGATFTYSAINFFFGISEMIVPASNYWNNGIGHAKGEVESDEFGLKTMQILGTNMANLMNNLNRK